MEHETDKSEINQTQKIELSARDIEYKIESKRVKKLIDAKNNKKNKIARERSNAFSQGVINKKQRDESYARTMKQVQNELPITKSIFSKVIHNNLIEKISGFIGSTIARPNAILFGAVLAFTLTLIVYYVSRTSDYKLSGFETIGSFMVGWTLGILFDYFRLLFTNKKD